MPDEIGCVATCQECGRPWGTILGRGVGPTPNLRKAARAGMVADLLDLWRCDDAQFDVDRLPDVVAVRVVHLTEAAVVFAEEHLRAETVLPDCWQELETVDLPSWFLRGRKQRWAYRWDCCEIRAPRMTTIGAESGSDATHRGTARYRPLRRCLTCRVTFHADAEDAHVTGHSSTRSPCRIEHVSLAEHIEAGWDVCEWPSWIAA